MPIVHTAYKFEDVPADAANLRWHHDSYLHTTISRWSSDDVVWQNLNPSIPVEDQPHNGYEYTPLAYAYDTHIGVCLFEREYNGYHDSDFYMVVWNVVEGKPQSIEFATTRADCGAAWGSKTDATPEVLAAYQAYKAAVDEANYQARQEELANTPAKGKTLKVVKGRKVKIGTTGVCIWLGNGQFGKRVGIKQSNGEVAWTALSNVEVVR